MRLVSENIWCMQIFATVPLGGGRQMAVGSSMTAIFDDFSGYFFGNVTYKTICTTHEICSKMNNLECLFHVKIRFRTAPLSRAYLSVS